IVLSINDQAVGDSGDLREEVAKLEAGDRARLRILREGSEQTFEVTAEESKSEGPGCPKGCPMGCPRGMKGMKGMGGMGLGPGAHAFALQVDPEEFEKMIPKDLDEKIQGEVDRAIEESRKAGRMPRGQYFFRNFGSDEI